MNSEFNLQQVVPLFDVNHMETSLRFYEDGLGFKITNKWIVDDKIKWCWLQREGAAIMLQELNADHPYRLAGSGKKGHCSSMNFICKDALALYHEFKSKKLEPDIPFVGNNMWVVLITDPDGFNLNFESETDVPEGSVYDEVIT